MPCAPGTAFNQSQCRCTEYTLENLRLTNGEFKVIHETFCDHIASQRMTNETNPGNQQNMKSLWMRTLVCAGLLDS